MSDGHAAVCMMRPLGHSRGAWRTFLVMMLVAVGMFAALPCGAADPKAASATSPPSALTRESARDLLSRMSDAEVRKMLLDQLDRAAIPETDPNKGGTAASGMAGMAGTMGAKSGRCASGSASFTRPSSRFLRRCAKSACVSLPEQAH